MISNLNSASEIVLVIEPKEFNDFEIIEPMILDLVILVLCSSDQVRGGGV